MGEHIKDWEDIYKKHRSYLIAFAFRTTGSLAEAEELVQDSFLECHRYRPEEIDNHRAWLMRICSNKAINHIKSAYKRREVYPGVWLPDEIPSGLEGWEDLKEKSESLTTSFLVLLEKLTPEQRVVFLLKDVFDYSFEEISDFLNKGVSNCRKIAQRAREFIEQNKVRFDAPPEKAMDLIYEFFVHAKNGDTINLKRMLAESSELLGDGGGKVSAAGHLVQLDHILDFITGLGKSEVFHSDHFKFEYRLVNARPGLIISKRTQDNWSLDTILSFEFRGQKIARIYGQRNPDRLKTLLPAALT